MQFPQHMKYPVNYTLYLHTTHDNWATASLELVECLISMYYYMVKTAFIIFCHVFLVGCSKFQFVLDLRSLQRPCTMVDQRLVVAHTCPTSCFIFHYKSIQTQHINSFHHRNLHNVFVVCFCAEKRHKYEDSTSLQGKKTLKCLKTFLSPLHVFAIRLVEPLFFRNL